MDSAAIQPGVHDIFGGRYRARAEARRKCHGPSNQRVSVRKVDNAGMTTFPRK